MRVLRKDVKLKIKDVDEKPNVRDAVGNYYELLENWLATIRATGALHAGEMLIPFGGK